MSAYAKQPKQCEQCGATMLVQPALMKRKRFCSRVCRGRAMVGHMNAVRPTPTVNAGTFKRGLIPWNKGVSVHLSPASEFKPGQRVKPYVPVGSERERIDKNGKRRMFVKVQDPNVWKLRAVLNWEATHGPVPQGSVIHHRDRDPLNDAPENLESLDRSAHIREHRVELRTAALAAACASSLNPGS